MVLIAVEAVLAGSKPPVAVSVRISTGGRHDFGAAALLSTKTSYLRGRAGGSAVMLKLVELVGPVSTLLAEQLSPCFARFAAVSSHACKSSCQVVCLRPWQDVAAKQRTRGLLNADMSLSKFCQ